MISLQWICEFLLLNCWILNEQDPLDLHFDGKALLSILVSGLCLFAREQLLSLKEGK